PGRSADRGDAGRPDGRRHPWPGGGCLGAVLGVRHLARPGARHGGVVAAPGPPGAAALRGDPVEHGVPAGHVRRRRHLPGPGRRPAAGRLDRPDRAVAGPGGLAGRPGLDGPARGADRVPAGGYPAAVTRPPERAAYPREEGAPVVLRMSTLFLRTLREDPADAELPGHRLLVRAGYVRRVAPGIYSWLPLGLRVLGKVEQVVREEMDAIGAQEVRLPALLPREPYEATNRWTEYGDNLFRLQDRRGNDMLLGPTHEG